MITKTCECGVVFEYEPVVGYPDKRKYCDTCKVRKKAEWDSKTGNPLITTSTPVIPPVPAVNSVDIAKETGTFQSTVWNHKVSANSYEVGKADNRFKLYFETPAELKAKMQELRDAGLMDLPLDQLPRD